VYQGNQIVNVTVERSVDVVSDEGTRFILYSASYTNRNKPEDNEVEQGHTASEALENLYQTLERKGFARENLPKPQGLLS
jgi:hypothetical protein